MRLRIGINFGEAIVDGDDTFDDGVNIAARLEGLCLPDGIAVSGVVHDQVADNTHGAFTDDGEHEVKNISQPVRVWRWLAEPVPTTTSGMSDDVPRLPDKPAIAVLPFQNMSNDAERDRRAIPLNILCSRRLTLQGVRVNKNLYLGTRGELTPDTDIVTVFHVFRNFRFLADSNQPGRLKTFEMREAGKGH